MSRIARKSSFLTGRLFESRVHPLRPAHQHPKGGILSPMYELLERRQLLSVAVKASLTPLPTKYSAVAATIVSTPSVSTASNDAEQISVEFTSRAAIKLRTINAQNVTDSAGLQVTGVTIISERQQRDVTATYSIAAPAGGWTGAQNGLHSFDLAAAKVRNQAGGKSVAIQGSFMVNIAPPVVTTPTPPAISSVSPAVAVTFHQPLTISGSGFENGLQLLFRDPLGNITDETGEVESTTSTQLDLSVSLVNTAGTWTAEVINPDGGDSGQFTFNVQQPVPAVSISSVSPATAESLLQSINLSGSGFENGLQLLFRDPSGNVTDGTAEIQSISSTQITSSVPFIDTAGTWAAEVINPDGGDSGQFTFNVQQPVPAVSISSVSPAVAVTFHQPLTISGSGFENGLQLLFRDPLGNITDETGEVESTTSTQLDLSVSLVNTAGTWTAEVINPDGGDSGQFTFNVQQPVPAVSISSVSPAVAVTFHQPLTISGSGFENGLQLLFRDPLGNITDETGEVESTTSTQLDLSVSLVNTAGTWTAEVINPDGGDSGQFTFNVQQSVSISSVRPATADSLQQPIIIHGSGFENGFQLVFRNA